VSMAEDQTSTVLLILVALVAIVGLGLALASFVTNESMGGMMGYGGGGMMNRTPSSTSAPGGLEWGILVVSAVFLAVAVAVLLRTRSGRGQAPAAARGTLAPSAPVSGGPAFQPASSPETAIPAAPGATAVPEPTLVKLLNEDERRMYLELRDHGGEMYQRDLVALGIFSKAKVTRVLDKLETKGLVVREAHGMTNRVRLVNWPPK